MTAMTTGTGKTMNVFVYGTLKRGFYNFYLLSGAQSFQAAALSVMKSSTEAEEKEKELPAAHFIGSYKTNERQFYLQVGSDSQIPYALKLDGASSVRPPIEAIESSERACQRSVQGGVIYGEVFRVNESMLAALDVLEGVPVHYVRETVEVDLASEHSELVDQSIATEGEQNKPTRLKCQMYLKTKADENLFLQPHMEVYDRKTHLNYVPPVLRQMVEVQAEPQKMKEKEEQLASLNADPWLKEVLGEQQLGECKMNLLRILPIDLVVPDYESAEEEAGSDVHGFENIYTVRVRSRSNISPLELPSKAANETDLKTLIPSVAKLLESIEEGSSRTGLIISAPCLHLMAADYGKEGISRKLILWHLVRSSKFLLCCVVVLLINQT